MLNQGITRKSPPRPPPLIDFIGKIGILGLCFESANGVSLPSAGNGVKTSSRSVSYKVAGLAIDRMKTGLKRSRGTACRAPTSQAKTQNHRFDKTEFNARYRESFGVEICLT
jgi:hypothetical protein